MRLLVMAGGLPRCWLSVQSAIMKLTTGNKMLVPGVPLDFVRVESPPGGFGVRVGAHNALFGDLTSIFEGAVSLHAVVDGYWSLLPPLSPGEHTLTFGGCSQDGCQTNTYTLAVRR